MSRAEKQPTNQKNKQTDSETQKHLGRKHTKGTKRHTYK